MDGAEGEFYFEKNRSVYAPIKMGYNHQRNERLRVVKVCDDGISKDFIQ